MPGSIEHFHRSKDGVLRSRAAFFFIRSRAFIVITVMKDIIKQEEKTVGKKVMIMRTMIMRTMILRMMIMRMVIMRTMMAATMMKEIRKQG